MRNVCTCEWHRAGIMERGTGLHIISISFRSKIYIIRQTGETIRCVSSNESLSREYHSTSEHIAIQQPLCRCMAFHKDQKMKVTHSSRCCGNKNHSHQSHHPLHVINPRSRSQFVSCGPIMRRPVIINCLFWARYMLSRESMLLPASNRYSNGHARLFLALFFSFFLFLPILSFVIPSFIVSLSASSSCAVIFFLHPRPPHFLFFFFTQNGEQLESQEPACHFNSCKCSAGWVQPLH